MSFAYRPAVRDRVGLLLGIAGPSGSGKTLSALRIARGLADGDDTRIAFIDTEGGRGKHYAPAPGEGPGPSRFAFQHGDLRPPFTPEAYQAAVVAAEDAGFDVIVIDSFSHCWDGDGGLQDMHTVALDKIAGDEAWKRDKLSVGAWKEPKLRHKRLVSRLLQCRSHLVICMRADEKLRMETVEENGRKKTVIVQPKDMPVEERWVPIVERRFPYELTVSLLLTPVRPGFPVPIKLQEQHRAAVPLDRPLSEDTGRALAAWARGGAATASPTPVAAPAAAEPSFDPSDLEAWQSYVTDHIAFPGETAASLREWWNSDVQKAERARFGTAAKPTHTSVLARIRELGEPAHG